MADQPIHGYINDDSEPEVSGCPDSAECNCVRISSELILCLCSTYQDNGANHAPDSTSTTVVDSNQGNSASQQVRILRLRLIAGHNLAKKDIFGASDPYVRIDLVGPQDNRVIDTVYTKTKKRVSVAVDLGLSLILLSLFK
jgi:hypothetical protein